MLHFWLYGENQIVLSKRNRHSGSGSAGPTRHDSQGRVAPFVGTGRIQVVQDRTVNAIRHKLSYPSSGLHTLTRRCRQ